MSAVVFMAVLPIRLFKIVVVNPASTVVTLAKNHRIARTRAPSVVLTYNKYDATFPYSPVFENGDSVNTVPYRPTPERLEQMCEHASVQESDDKSLKSGW